VALIAYGVLAHAENLPSLIPQTMSETSRLTQQMGWVFAASLFLRAYSLGGGTYTGIEAVSNNVQSLVEPRVSTGKWTMFYMAVSLSLIAGGIILLYLLWDATPEEGQTLNAVTFRAILQSTGWDSPVLQKGLFDRRASARGRLAAGRGQYWFPRRAGRPCEHGGRLLGAASVSLSLHKVGDAARHSVDGCGGLGNPGGH
jgi:hypothetical protein